MKPDLTHLPFLGYFPCKCPHCLKSAIHAVRENANNRQLNCIKCGKFIKNLSATEKLIALDTRDRIALEVSTARIATEEGEPSDPDIQSAITFGYRFADAFLGRLCKTQETP